MEADGWRILDFGLEDIMILWRGAGGEVGHAKACICIRNDDENQAIRKMVLIIQYSNSNVLS